MVQTRSALLREKAGHSTQLQLQEEHRQTQSEIVQNPNKLTVVPDDKPRTEGSFTVVGEHVHPPPPMSASSFKVSNKSSLEARKKQLEYEAAMATAELENQILENKKRLIQKKTEAEIAALEEEYSIKGGSIPDSKNMVEQWLEQSHADVEERPRTSGPQHTAATAAPTDIQHLARALEVFTRSTTNNNTQLLSRLAAPKDLPHYYGDALEWLQFKRSYQQSNNLCSYTDAENIVRLSKCLRGEAKEAVSALLISDATPDAIIEALELRFGRPEVVIHKIITQIKKIPALPQAYHGEIVNFAVKIKNFVAAARAIKQSDYLRSPELLTTVISKCPTVLITKWTDFAYENQDDTKSKLELFADFLHSEATRTAAVGISHIHLHNQPDNRKRFEERKSNPYPNTVLLAESVESDNKCPFCRSKKPHKIPDCSRFKRALRRDRWRFVTSKRLCHRCLDATHSKDTCTAPTCDLEECGLPHHPLLHWPSKYGGVKNGPEKSAEKEEESVNSVINETVTNTNISKTGKVLLKVVRVKLHGPIGDVITHALLDDGASVSLISAAIANSVGLHGLKENMRVRGAWNSAELQCISEVVNFDISNSDNNKFNLRARKVSELDLPIQTLSSVKISDYEHLMTLKDYLCCEDAKPQILIGQDNYHLIVPKKTVIKNNNQPCATETPLGWCLHGVVPTSACQPVGASVMTTYSALTCTLTSSRDVPCHNDCITDDALSVLSLSETHLSHHAIDERMDELLRQSFAFEAIGVSNTPRKNPNDELAKLIVENSANYVNGKWEVGLPWKAEPTEMTNSYPQAFRRLKTIEKKFNSYPECAERYKERVNYLFENDYAREITKDEVPGSRLWYLPHFGVDNPNKQKLRLVFDAAAKSNGYSLNDYLHQGPDLLQPLLGVMFRFREGSVGISGDIKDMFLRVKIIEKDQHALRFLWRDNSSKPIKEYAMTSLIFGANCSPFIAQYVKNKNAMQYESSKPEAVKAILYNHYMDDYIDSFDDVITAVTMMHDVTEIHAKGNFEIRNWSSNKTEVCQHARKETLSTTAIRLNIGNDSERTLGLLWFPSTDTLGFDLSLKRIPEKILTCETKPTKREVLKIVMSIYDIYGILAPYTMQAKILIQNIWKSKTEWDDQINDDHFTVFKTWISQLESIKTIRIPRWYFANELITKRDGARDKISTADPRVTETNELHLFCDASPSGYCSVAYWRKVTDKGDVYVSFIASKSRVSPIKHISIPKMELQGALLSCRLASTIKKEHRIISDRTYYWTDSQTVLHWIKNNTRSYKVFVANRLGEIDELSNPSDWYYVPSEINIADVATKFNNYEMSSSCEWFTGPSFLHKPHLRLPQPAPETQKTEINKDDLEMIHTVYAPDSDLPVPDATRFSTWLRLRRTTAYALLFIDLCRKKTNSRVLNAELMERAEVLLIRAAQSSSFPNEVNLLSNKNPTPKDSQLRTLTPFIDAQGVLRVGGRISAAKGVDQQVKQPVILDGRHQVARLIVKHYHARAAHGNNEMVVNELRQRYWLLRLRPTVRAIAAQCLICRIRRATPKPPQMADLPVARLAHHQRPYTHCGVDLFGPMEITVGRRRDRRYGVLFTCMTVRAVHIEMVPSLSADSFIMALRRMAARRGWPQHMYSDNATNFHGADNELKRAYLEKEVTDEVSNRNMTWHFISPASPHMGGAWERLIRSVKTSLKVVLNERAPREETLMTLLAEVENIVNSKPLTHVSVKSDDDETLTPNHFMIGGSSNMSTPGVFEDGDLYLRRQWRIAQRLTDMFWNRWVKEVLPTLLPRQKWHYDHRPIEVGDIVLIADPNAPRNTWLKGRIQQVYPGKDGRIRIVDVKTKSGSLRRPMTRIVRLPTEPTDDECH